MIVCGQEFSAGTIRRINNWRGENGKLKEMSCRKALLKLNREGKIELPEAEKPKSLKNRKITNAIQEVEITDICCELKELEEIEIIAVKSRYSQESRIWNYMMQEYHYLGPGPLCGAQIRYLVSSSKYGWIGGLSFSASAWKIKGRDEYVGWSDSARHKNLQLVVNNSRFLIAPGVKVRNLASHILSICTKQLRDDWFERYGYSPVLLETFVDSEKHKGTIYKAANWIYAGKTAGRGRDEKKNLALKTPKILYLYPLCKDWRSVLTRDSQKCSSPVMLTARREPEDWADEEFGCVRLKDRRLRRRLLFIARDFYARPGANIPEASGNRAKAKGVYRFLDNSMVEMKTLLTPHYEATLERIKRQEVVLAVQDTTSLNYTAHPTTQGLGPITTKKKNSIGLIVHDTLTFNGKGTPLGLLDVQCWARDAEDAGKSERRHSEPIENKESFKWLKSYRAVAEAQKRCPDTTLVSVGDRESDIYELFTEALIEPSSPKLLVRAERTRQRIVEHETLWEKMRGEDVAGIQEIHVPRSGSRPARDARLEVRFADVILEPPKKKKGLKPILLWAVLASEIDYNEDVKSPLEWMLLTTIPVSTFEQATEKLIWYARRWGIEVYHRVIKSGCKIEDRQLGNTKRIESCLAIDMVVAWRIYHLTKLGRETPELPCTVYFDEDEWKALVAFKTKNPEPPEIIPCLRDAIRMVASLGGFLGRKGDGEPGTTTLWRGLQRLDDITATWRICMTLDNNNKPLVPSKQDYG